MANGNVVLMKTGAGHAQPVPTVNTYEWSMTAVAASVLEGGDIQPTINLNRNGATPPANEFLTVDFQYGSVAALASPVAGGSDYSVGPAASITNAVAAYNIANPTHQIADAVNLGGSPTRYRLTVDRFFTALPISRTTINFPTAQGNKHAVPGIAAVSQGTILVAQAPITIVDRVVPAIVSVPVLNQTDPVVGVPITCSQGVWTNNPTSYAYQWQKGSSNIVGATSSSYTPVSGDIGSTLRCSVLASNADGPATAASFSAASSVVAANPTASVPVISVVPAISDTNPVVGVAITCSPGTWTNSPTSFTYQWQKGTTDIVGATAASYTPVAGDVGSTLRCGVIATNGTGSSTISRSSSTAAVAAAALADIILGTSAAQYPQGPSCLVSALEDADLDIDIKGVDSLGNVVALDSATISNNDGFARFKIASLKLKVGAVLPDFEGPLVTGGSLGSNSFTLGVSRYFVTISGVKGGVTIQKQFSIRAKFPKIAPTGAGASPVETRVPTDYSSLNHAIVDNPGFVGRYIDLTGFTGIIEANQNNSMIGLKTNFTIEGNRNCIWGKDVHPRIEGDNIILRNDALRVGGDLVGEGRNNRDCLEIANAHDVLVQNLSCTWSIDEVASFISLNASRPIRRLRIFRCVFAEALINSGHDSTEPSHPYGPIIYVFTMSVVVDKCFFSGNVQRNPAFKGATRGVVVQNCVITKYGTNSGNGGIGWYPENGSTPNRQNCTGVARANLFITDGTANQRAHAFVISDADATNEIYIPGPTDTYANHFFSIATGHPGTPNFASDPLDPTVHRTMRGTAVQAAIKNYMPFDLVDDYGLMPTNSVAARQALFDDVMDNVGVRLLTGPVLADGTRATVPGDLNASFIDYEILDYFRRAGSNRNQTGGFAAGKYLPADFDPALLSPVYTVANPP